MVSYKPLFRYCLEHDIPMADCRKICGISPNTWTKINKNEEVSMTILNKICAGLGVEPAHIRVVVPLKKNYEEMKQIIREEIEYRGVSVIIPRRECIQTAKRHAKAREAAKKN